MHVLNDAKNLRRQDATSPYTSRWVCREPLFNLRRVEVEARASVRRFARVCGHRLSHYATSCTMKSTQGFVRATTRFAALCTGGKDVRRSVQKLSSGSYQSEKICAALQLAVTDVECRGPLS